MSGRRGGSGGGGGECGTSHISRVLAVITKFNLKLFWYFLRLTAQWREAAITASRLTTSSPSLPPRPASLPSCSINPPPSPRPSFGPILVLSAYSLTLPFSYTYKLNSVIVHSIIYDIFASNIYNRFIYRLNNDIVYL